jgi:opacity protein-like surface antigen
MGGFMKKLVSLFTTCCLCLLSVPAFAATPGFFVGGNLGVMVPEDSTIHTRSGDVDVSFNAGATVSVVGGYKFANGLRLEGELNSRSVDTDKASANGRSLPYDSTISAFGLMTNIYYDINTNSRFNPYIGGGIGLAYLETDDSIFYRESGSTVFAYQLGAGLAYDITPRVTMDLGYRYYGTTTAEFEFTGGSEKMSLNTHNFIIGARYNF